MMMVKNRSVNKSTDSSASCICHTALGARNEGDKEYINTNVLMDHKRRRHRNKFNSRQETWGRTDYK